MAGARFCHAIAIQQDILEFPFHFKNCAGNSKLWNSKTSQPKRFGATTLSNYLHIQNGKEAGLLYSLGGKYLASAYQIFKGIQGAADKSRIKLGEQKLFWKLKKNNSILGFAITLGCRGGHCHETERPEMGRNMPTVSPASNSYKN